jgi:hypothetical protein
MRRIALIVVTTIAALSPAGAIERVQGPCKPGYVKAVIHEAGSCLGDYKKRVANEPIAFCRIAREKCVPEQEKLPMEAESPAGSAAPTTDQP